MVRSVAVIAWAIGLSQPSMPEKVRNNYAKVIREESKSRGIDPFTFVSIVHFESRWRQGVVSPDGEDFGLGQIRARYMKGCRGLKDPVNEPSEECLATKGSLLSGVYNLRLVARAITRWRKTCQKKTNRRALFRRWLHGYGGMGNLKKGILCGMRRTKKGWVDLPLRKELKKRLDYRLQLIARSRRRRR